MGTQIIVWDLSCVPFLCPQKEGKRPSRVDATVEEMNDSGLPCVGQKQWRTQKEIGLNEIAGALTMTYRAGRWSEPLLIP